jgi:hypothetical protein
MQLTSLDQFLADSPHQSIQKLHQDEEEGKVAAIQRISSLTPSIS